MSNAVDSLIKDRISSFVQELDQLVRKSTLEALSHILANGAAPARRGRPAGTSRGPGRPKGSGRGGNVEEVATKIVAHVQANDGQGIGAIASAVGIPLPLAKKAAVQLRTLPPPRPAPANRSRRAPCRSARRRRAGSKIAGPAFAPAPDIRTRSPNSGGVDSA